MDVKKKILICGSQLVNVQELWSGHSSVGFSDSKPGFSLLKTISVKAY